MKKMKNKKIVIPILIVCLIVMYSFVFLDDFSNFAKATSFDDVKDTLSSSAFNASSSHTVVIDMGDANYLLGGGYIRVVLNTDFTNLTDGGTACPTKTTASTTVSFNTVDCVVDAGEFLEATSTQTVIIYNIANPSSDGDRDVQITTYTAADVEIEDAQVRVYILDDVTMLATVNSILEFTLDGMTNAETVNGVNCTENTTAATTSFGVLTTTGSSTVCQELTVETNADFGFTVTVEQDQELTNQGGSNINSFNNSMNGTGSTTPQAWLKPLNTFSEDWTYGHMGLTSEDTSLDNSIWSTTTPYLFAGVETRYVGFNDTAPVQVMYNDGPSDGSTAGIGLTQVAYTAEIKSLQEAGDYTNILTYICTPTY